MISNIVIIAIAVIGILGVVAFTQREQIQSIFLSKNESVNPSPNENTIPVTTLHESVKPSATECKFAGQRLSENYYCSYHYLGNGEGYLEVKEIPQNQMSNQLPACSVRIVSMTIDASGSGELVMNKGSNCTDTLNTISVNGIAKVSLDYVLNPNESTLIIPFNLKTRFTEGQQVTAVISMQSGITITQTLTVSGEVTSSNGGPQVKIVSMMLSAAGNIDLVMSNSGNAEDAVNKVTIYGIGDTGATALAIAVPANTDPVPISITLAAGFADMTEGQQVTAVIQMQSGASITQTVTVSA